MSACARCGRRVSLDWVALVDECPGCRACPFVQAGER